MKVKRDEYLIGIHDLPAILEAATKHGCNHVTNNLNQPTRPVKFSQVIVHKRQT